MCVCLWKSRTNWKQEKDATSFSFENKKLTLTQVNLQSTLNNSKWGRMQIAKQGLPESFTFTLLSSKSSYMVFAFGCFCMMMKKCQIPSRRERRRNWISKKMGTFRHNIIYCCRHGAKLNSKQILHLVLVLYEGDAYKRCNMGSVRVMDKKSDRWDYYTQTMCATLVHLGYETSNMIHQVLVNMIMQYSYRSAVGCIVTATLSIHIINHH